MAQKDRFLTWLAGLIGLSCVTSTSEYLLRANEFIKQTKMQNKPRKIRSITGQARGKQ